jgi:hypothetical protein
MQKQRLWRKVKVMLVATFVVAIGGTGTAMAVTSTSNNYQITETQFSAGSLQSCSAQYCAQASIGDTTSSTKASTGAFGITPDNVPVLQMIVEAGASNLGVLSTETTATKITTVKIKSYLSDGYVLQIIGEPPKFNGHNLATPTTPTNSQQGVEQFGINLAINTTPNVGLAPVQVPSGAVNFGVAYDDYDTPNQFMYVSGDNVAHSLTESGETDYTISMIVNISSSTPAGRYSGDFAAVMIPLY